MSHDNAQNPKFGHIDEPHDEFTEFEPMKICSKCGEEKPVSEFGFITSTPDRLTSKCKDCFKQPERELKFPDSTRRPGNLPDQLIRDIRKDRGTRSLTDTDADDKGLSINALASKYSDVYYDSKKYTLTWRLVRDILTGRSYSNVD